MKDDRAAVKAYRERRAQRLQSQKDEKPDTVTAYRERRAQRIADKHKKS